MQTFPPPRHEISFEPIKFRGSSVQIAWHVQPATPLYRQTAFTLDFGKGSDPDVLPLRFWWSLALLCVHAHWNILRPCRVRLPVTLPDTEIEFWSRLLDAERTTLEKYRGTADYERNVAIVCDGPFLELGELPAANDRHATAFSGGKDSLTQAALLCELTPRPLLVNTYSPLPPFLADYSPYRESVLAAMPRRRDCEVVIVKSDYRSICRNVYPRKLGYLLSVNEMTDVFIFTANLLAVAAAQGIRNVYQATQFRFTGLGLIDDRIFQYEQFMMSPLTWNPLAALFGQWGINYSSMITALSNFQIQQLLCTRYPDIRDLQLSCWSLSDLSQRYCSRCRKCFQVGIVRLALGLDPAEIGIDVHSLFGDSPDWSHGSTETITFAAAKIDLDAVRPYFRKRTWRERLGRDSSGAFRNLEALVQSSRGRGDPTVVQYRPDYMQFIPDKMRMQLDGVYRQHWPEVDSTDRSAQLALLKNGIRWITAPLVVAPMNSPQVRGRSACRTQLLDGPETHSHSPSG